MFEHDFKNLNKNQIIRLPKINGYAMEAMVT